MNEVDDQIASFIDDDGSSRAVTSSAFETTVGSSPSDDKVCEDSVNIFSFY
jgi:hypothetical protein